MYEDVKNKKHYNLYYIFESDKQKHSLSPDVAEKMRKNIFKKIFKNIKPSGNKSPPS